MQPLSDCGCFPMLQHSISYCIFISQGVRILETVSYVLLQPDPIGCFRSLCCLGKASSPLNSISKVKSSDSVRWWRYASNYLDECRRWGDVPGYSTSIWYGQEQRVEKGRDMPRFISAKYESCISIATTRNRLQPHKCQFQCSQFLFISLPDWVYWGSDEAMPDRRRQQ